MKHFNNNRIILPAVKINEKLYEYLKDSVFYIAGSAIYAVSVSVFTAPNQIAPGGITGISTILHYMFGLPIGIMILVLNIPLFVLGTRFIGGKFIIRTVICTALVSVFIDIMGLLPQYQYHGNLLLAALYGGVISGAGLGLVFHRGATTGGTDIASRLLRLKYPHIPMGRMMLFIDFLVVASAAIYFRSLNDAMYAIIAIFTGSRVIDGILYGADNGRMVMIISDKENEVAKLISEEINRGVTLLKGRGYYSGHDRDVLMCAVRRPEAARLRMIVRKADPAAFIIMCEADEVIGEGFKPITKDD